MGIDQGVEAGGRGSPLRPEQGPASMRYKSRINVQIFGSQCANF